MSILFSGSFNANRYGELSDLTRKKLTTYYGEERFNAIRYHIILGDAGFMWSGNERKNRSYYHTLDRRPFPIFCVLGNHDPFLGMENKQEMEVDIGIGETVYKINENPFVAYLKRGKVYTFDGLKTLVLGGALSHDKNSRIPGKTWWENEYWSPEEKKAVFKLLETENSFDLVLSHTGPHQINKLLFENKKSKFPDKFNDEVAFLNDDIQKKIKFRQWLCSHWYKDYHYRDKTTGSYFDYLYKESGIVEKINDKISYSYYGETGEIINDFNIQILKYNDEIHYVLGLIIREN